MLGKLLIFNLISFNTVCNTNTNTNANEIKALTRIESEKNSYTVYSEKESTFSFVFQGSVSACAEFVRLPTGRF